MIRINLLRNIGAAAVNPALVFSPTVGGDSKKEAYKRLAIMFILPIVLIFYERYTLGIKEDRISKVKARISQLQSEREKFGPVADLVSKYSDQQKFHEKQLEIMRELTKNRLREVKALDALQSLLPPTTWLKEVRMKGDGVDIVGYSLNEEGTPTLIRALEASAFFTDVEVKGANQEAAEGGTYNKFSLEFKVGQKK